MALPTITNNSPSAGYISWTSFGVQYNGASYTIAAGNTSNAYVWWEYATNTVKTASAGALPNLAADDLLLFINKTGIGALVPTMDVYDGSLIVNGSILAAAIGVDQVNATHIAANSIGVSELAANSVTANAIAASAITAEKLSVGSIGDSLISNGSFEDISNGLPVAWSSTGLANGGSVDVVTGVASSGTNAARLVATGTTSTATLLMLAGYYIPVSASFGRKWYINANVGAGTAVTTGFNLRARWYDAAKAYLSSTDILVNQAVGTSWAPYEGQVTPPSTARYMNIELTLSSPNVATNVYIDEVSAREVVVAAVIGDGQISTAKLQANAIDAMTINGATIIGGEVKTTATTGQVTARMGPQSVWDFQGGTTRAGIGFSKIGTNDAYPAGMYSVDGSAVTLQQSNSGGAGGSYITLGGTNQDILAYSYNATVINARGGFTANASIGPITLTASNGGIGLTGATSINGTPMVVKHAEFYNNGFATSANTSWDVGPLTLDTGTNRQWNNDFCAVGPVSGSVKILTAGFYVFSLAASGFTGNAWVRLQNGAGEVFSISMTTGYMGDVYSCTAPVYMAANDYVRGVLTTANGNTITSRLRVHKIPF